MECLNSLDKKVEQHDRTGGSRVPDRKIQQIQGWRWRGNRPFKKGGLVQQDQDEHYVKRQNYRALQ